MIFKNVNLLNDVVLDYTNPEKIYKLAREYDKLEQGAAAAGWYLRAADMCKGETFEEKWLQYKCMILSAFIYDRNLNRDQSTMGLLKIAVETLPQRPEAYFFLSKYYQGKNEWRDSLMYAKIGISCYDNGYGDHIDDDIDYPGQNALELLYARAKWKTDGRDDSKNLAFNLRYKRVLEESVSKEVEELLKQHGYPSTLPYTKEEISKYKYKFNGLEKVNKNYSRHFQDMFVLSVLKGKEKGTFIELGSGHPELFNNTLLLEKEFGWKGISIDNSERMCHIFSRERNTSVFNADAANIDYKILFKQSCIESHVDFLRINAEGASIQALNKMPFSDHIFSVIQFQHNSCWWGPEFKEESRKILKNIGYELLVPDVAVNETDSYEDWWVHPTIAAANKYMKSAKKINFAWTYMMEI